MNLLEQLKTDWDKAFKELTAAEELLAKAEEENKDVEGRKKVYDELRGKAQTLKGRLERAREQAEFQRMRDEASNMADSAKDRKPEIPGDLEGKDGAGKVPAKARDMNKEEKEREEIFQRFMMGEDITSQERQALTPDGKSWKSGDATSGVAMPPRFARIMMPEFFMPRTVRENLRGKAVPMLSTDSAGGANLVPTDFRDTLLYYPGEEAHLFPRCKQIPAGRGNVTFPKLTQAAPGAENSATEFAEYGSVACEWIEEGGTKPETEAKFEQLAISCHELAARTEISKTLLRRSVINLESFLAEEFRASIMHKLDLAVIQGTGTGQPQGITVAPGVRTVARSTAGAVVYNDLVNLEHRIAPQFRNRAIWIFADTVLQSLKLLKDTTGRPLWAPGMANGVPATVLGYPYVTTQRTTLGTAGDVIFGDCSQYVCPVEQEIVLFQSAHRKIEKNLIVYVVFMLVGGKVGQDRAFTYLEDAGS